MRSGIVVDGLVGVVGVVVVDDVVERVGHEVGGAHVVLGLGRRPQRADGRRLHGEAIGDRVAVGGGGAVGVAGGGGGSVRGGVGRSGDQAAAAAAAAAAAGSHRSQRC